MSELANQAEPVTKFTDWNDEPTLEKLKSDLDLCKPHQAEQANKITHWLNHLNIEGDAKPKPAKKNRSSVQPRLIRQHAEWRYASLTEPLQSEPDLFKCYPVTWEDVRAAEKNQLILSHQTGHLLDRDKFIDEYVRTAVDEGTVIVRVGWDYQDETYTAQEPVFAYIPDPALAEQLESLLAQKQESPSDFMNLVSPDMQESLRYYEATGIPVRAVITGYQAVEKVRILRNQPTWEICDYRNVFIDPTCQGDLKKAGFVVYSFETSISELEKDGRYRNLEYVRTGNHSPLAEPDYATDDTSGFQFQDTARKKVVVFEYWGYWDIDGSGIAVPIVAAWVGNTLIRLEENPFPDKQHPFVVVQYRPVRKSVYGEPEAELLIENQKIVGAITRAVIDIIGNAAVGQRGFAKNALDPVNRRKFESGQDYEYNPNFDPRLAMLEHTIPEIPASAQYLNELMRNDANALSGVPVGATSTNGQVKQQGDMLESAMTPTAKREKNILNRLIKGLEEIAQKFIAMNQVFLDDETIVRITNSPAEFIQIHRDDLAGNVNVRIEVSTPQENEQRAQELAFMLQTLGNSAPPEMTTMLLSKIARLRRMPDLAHALETFEPQPDPVAEQMRMLELKLLEAEVMLTMGKAQEAMSEVALDQARIRNLDSDTDFKNLDFVEQESGVKQERDIQRITAQGAMNMRLKELEGQIEMLKARYQKKSSEK